MPDLGEVSDRLKVLATQPPTPEHRAELADALDLEREGLDVLAARVLSSWGDEASLTTLRQLLEAQASKEGGAAATRAIARALAPHMNAGDVEWAIDLYLVHAHPCCRDSLLALVEALPPDRAVPELQNRFLALDRSASRDARLALRRFNAGSA